VPTARRKPNIVSFAAGAPSRGGTSRPFGAQSVTSIPGVSDIGAQVIVSEIGTDMSRFPSESHLISWAGMCPRNDENASKRRSNRVRKGAPWLKTTLVQCAWAAVRKKDSYLKAQFLRIKARRGPKKAIMAVAASILTAIYHMLKDGTLYQDLGSNHFQPGTMAFVVGDSRLAALLVTIVAVLGVLAWRSNPIPLLARVPDHQSNARGRSARLFARRASKGNGRDRPRLRRHRSRLAAIFEARAPTCTNRPAEYRSGDSSIRTRRPKEVTADEVRVPEDERALVEAIRRAPPAYLALNGYGFGTSFDVEPALQDVVAQEAHKLLFFLNLAYIFCFVPPSLREAAPASVSL
jgi:Transposase IS116/IS110/IS902 family